MLGARNREAISGSSSSLAIADWAPMQLRERSFRPPAAHRNFSLSRGAESAPIEHVDLLLGERVVDRVAVSEAVAAHLEGDGPRERRVAAREQPRVHLG